MVIKCPKCGERIDVDEAQLSTGEVKVKCSHCYAMFAIKRGVKKTEAPKQPAIIPPLVSGETEGLGGEYQGASIAVADKAISEQRAPEKRINLKKVIVAMDGDAAVKIINDVLTENGFEIINAPDGRTVLSLIEAERPAVAILDVGLPHIFGFEISEIIRNSEKLKDTIVILVASIYDKTRYKREPISLFGADDYIEKHHIRDSLITKINGLLEDRFPGMIHPEHHEAAEAKSLRTLKEGYDYSEKNRLTADDVDGLKNDELPPMEEERVLEVEKKEAPLSLEHEKAKRFARIIISDISLYNQKAVEDGIKKNNFYEMLKAEIEEGRKLYEKRVSQDIIFAANYYDEMLEEFIKNKRRSLGLSEITFLNL
ncbi:MAG: response regulator [Nitrospirota bacterium]